MPYNASKHSILPEPKGIFPIDGCPAFYTPSFAHREKIRTVLLAEHIESRPLWKPMHCNGFSKCLSFTDGTSENAV